MKFTSRMKVQRMIANPNHLRMGNREVVIRLQRESSKTAANFVPPEPEKQREGKD
jgi:hypothetical protein